MLSIFGIDSGGLSLVTNLLVLFLIVTYLALIYWTYLDARRRIEDPVLIACATAASVFPFVGTVIYTILRPPEFLEDREERELELRAAELRLRQLIDQACPHCEYPIERDYLRCPNCERRLRNPCRKCTRPLDPKWGVCPYCETEVRRRRERSEGDRSRAARARAARSGRPTRAAADQPRSSGSSSEGSDGQTRRQRERDTVAQGSRQERPSEGRRERPES
jgi:RNA polymerase subunit RPABC4/transcription elongation factor Spt4